MSTVSLDTGAAAIGAGAEASAATAREAPRRHPEAEAVWAIAAVGRTLTEPKASDRASAARRAGIEVFDMVLLSD